MKYIVKPKRTLRRTMEQNPLIIGGVHHPHSVVINDFYSKTGVWADAEQLLIQRAAFTQVTDKFCQLPVLLIE